MVLILNRKGIQFVPLVSGLHLWEAVCSLESIENLRYKINVCLKTEMNCAHLCPRPAGRTDGESDTRTFVEMRVPYRVV